MEKVNGKENGEQIDPQKVLQMSIKTEQEDYDESEKVT